MENNKYQDLINEENENKISQVKGAIFANEGVEPDTKARALEISNKYSLPIEFVEKNISDFEEKEKKTVIPDNKYEALLQEYPDIADYMSDTTNAGIAKDSIDELKDISDKANKSGLREFSESLVYGSLQMAKGLTGFVKMNQDEKNEFKKYYKNQNIDPKFQKFFDEKNFGIFTNEQLDAAKQYLETTSKQFENEAAQKSIIEETMKGNIGAAGKALYLNALQTIPQLAVIAVNAPVGMGLLFGSEAGGKYQENIEKGIDQETARLNARLTGAVSTAIESLGGVGQADIFKSTVKKMVSEFGEQTTGQVIKQTIKEIGKNVGKNYAEEGGEEALTTAAQAVIDYSMSVDENAFDNLLINMGDAFLIGGAAGGGIAIVQSPAIAIKRYQESAKTTQAVETYDQLGEAAKNSKLKKRSPEKFEEFVAKSTENSPFKDVFVDVAAIEKFFQKDNKNPQEEMAKIGLLDPYVRAKETGADTVSIPYSAWVAKTVDTDLYAAVRGDIKYHQDDVTLNQKTKETEELNAEIKTQLDQVAKADQEGAEIIDDIYNQLIEANVPKAEAKKQAAVYRAFKVLAQRAGMSPKELFSKYGVTIKDRSQGSVKEQIIPQAPRDMEPPVVMKESFEFEINPQYRAEPVTETETQARIEDPFAIIEDPFAISETETQVQEETPEARIARLQQEYESRWQAEQDEFAADLIKREDGSYNYDPSTLNMMASAVRDGQAGYRYFKPGQIGGDQDVIASGSTFPVWFQNKGITKDRFLKIIKKYQDGGQLTESQIYILNDMYEGAIYELRAGRLFQFGGQEAQGAKINRLSDAAMLDKAGASQDEIRRQTGWFKGPDNRWRFEISDAGAELKPVKLGTAKTYKLSEVIKHDVLFTEYPALKDITVKLRTATGSKAGSYSRQTKTLTVFVDKQFIPELQPIEEQRAELRKTPEYKAMSERYFATKSKEVQNAIYADFLTNTEVGKKYKELTNELSKGGFKKQLPKTLPKSDDVLNTMLHEIQHAIQEIEGFNPGAAAGKSQFSRDKYFRTLGEIEARDVEFRKGLTDQERLEKIPDILKFESPIINQEKVRPEREIPATISIGESKETFEVKEDKNGQLRFFQKEGDAKSTSQNLTESENFKQWFGDSKVVDENGKPLVVYHGTGNIFEEFDYSKVGELGRSEGAGFYFTEKKEVAQAYEKSGGQVMEVYLSIKNPMPIQREGFNKKEIKALLKEIVIQESKENGVDEADTFISNFGDVRTFGLNKILTDAADAIANGDLAIEQLGGLSGAGVQTKILNKSVEKVLGFDGIVSRGYYHQQLENIDTGFNVYVAFNPEQIKSVNNKGAFDPSNPNIYSQEAKGAFIPGANIIELFQAKDQSTFLHESAHLFLTILNDLSKTTKNESLKKDIEEIKKWTGNDDLMSVDAQEKFARGFEEYLMKGEAPVKELKKAFNTFKVWLTRLYKKYSGPLQMAGYDLKITPEIKGVMDRLLATEEEINQAEAEASIPPLFADMSILSEEDQVKYAEILEQARLFAEAKLNKALLDEMKKKQTKEYKERLKNLTASIKDQLSGSAIYVSLKKMRDNEIKFDRGILKTAFGQDAIKLLPRDLMTNENGLDYKIVAQMLGFSDAEGFVNELIDTPSLDLAAKAEAEAILKEQMPELFNEPEIRQEAMEAIHNENRGKLLEFELDFLRKRLMKDATRKITRRQPPIKEIKEAAIKFIGKSNIKDIKPYEFLRLERKHARDAGFFLSQGKIEQALESKKQEYFNYELYRAATDAVKNIEKVEKSWNKIFKSTEDLSKSRDIDLVNAAREILAMYGIVGGRDVSPETYLNKIREYDPQQYEVILPIVQDATEGAADYRDVSYDKFTEMSDTVDALWSLSRENKTMEINKRKTQIEDAVADLTFAMNSYDPVRVNQFKVDLSDREKFKMDLLGAASSLKRVEFWADLMDLGSKNGPFTKYIWQPVSEAITQYRLDKANVMKKYEGIISKYKDIFTNEPIIAEGLDYTFKSKQSLLMAILHSGNLSNKSKLLRGRGWGSVDENGVLNSAQYDAQIDKFMRDGVLTKRDFEFAQEIWDLMESLKPAAQKAHKKQYGFYFNEITANEIKTPFGDFRGGYIPAKVDAYLNEDAAVRKEMNEFENNNNSFQFPTTGRGFSKTRVDAYAAPLMLELNMLGGHIDSVLRFTHIEPAVRQVNHLIKNKNFASRLGDIDKKAISEMLTPWLQRSAAQRVVLPASTATGKLIDRFASVLRTNVAMQFMIGNVTNAAQQITGIIVANSKVKKSFLKNAMFNMTVNREKTVQSILDKSDWMKSNQDSTVYESQEAIKEVILNPSIFQNIKSFATKHTYFLQSMTQNYVNGVVWLGAYDQAISEGMTEKEAVRKADGTVRMTQGTVNAEDISRFEVGTATTRLFTQFYGYFNMLANLNAAELMKIHKSVGLKKGQGQLFHLYVSAFMLPAVGSAAIVALGRGGLDDEDDDGILDEALALFFGSQVSTITASVPFVGALANSAIARFNGNPVDDRLTLSPVLSVLEAAAGVPYSIAKGVESGEIKKRATKDVLLTLGVLSGLPIGPIGRPVGYLMDVESGKAEPTGPVDFTRGLVTGQPGNN